MAVSVPAFGQERQERWELGVAGGYCFYKDVSVTNTRDEGTAGFHPGLAFGVVAGNQVRSWLSGEARYTYQQDDLKLSFGGQSVRFDGESHALHYDFVFLLNGPSARIRPFLAAGAGVKIYRGTGRESAFQPLNRFAVLTRTQQVTPLFSVGGGVKFAVSRLVTIRAEARDYVSTFPDQVIAPVPPSRARGWLHDFVPMLGVSFTFGR